MRLLSLDIGDRWIGTATSDPLKISAKPYQTVEINQLEDFLRETIKEKCVSTIVVGRPKTLSGKESEQTKKTIKKKEELEKIFPSLEWVLWDEKLSSKYAEKLKPARNKEGKMNSPSIAAAFILQSYLDHLQFRSTFN